MFELSVPRVTGRGWTIGVGRVSGVVESAPRPGRGLRLSRTIGPVLPPFFPLAPVPLRSDPPAALLMQFLYW
jgi:hypothetical protein